MKGDSIFYRDGYKYQLFKTCQILIDIHPPADIITDYILLNREGMLSIMRGYTWNGPDVIPDTPSVMRGSLVHDVGYQLLREGCLAQSYREPIDNLMRSICLEDGTLHAYAEAIYLGVQLGAGPAADPANDRPVIEAP